jgi:vacuolar-type H+-ATPase subunit I/STV1
MDKKIKDLQGELALRNQKIQAMKKKIAGLKMQILSHEAQVKDMARRAGNQQQRLDAAIIEVVRTKARLRSLESKAEAASTIAEAEIAVNALKKRAPSVDEVTREEIAAADQLLKMSMEEFQARNFGGALYLASQAKGQVRAVQMQISVGAETAILKGEEPFSQPLPLTLIKNSNLRKGPGLDEKILATLSKGTQVTGYAYKESWVKVKTKDGMTGWLFQSLVEVR